MKRSEALAEIRQAGWHNDTTAAAIIQAKKHIGSATARKAFTNGQKMKERGEPCDCPKCAKEKK